MEPRSPALLADSLPAEPPGKPKNTGVGSLSLLQWIFPTQESNQGLLHCRQILYQLATREAPQRRSFCPNRASRVKGGTPVWGRPKPGPQGIEKAQGQALTCRSELPLYQGSPLQTPHHPRLPPPGMALTIEVHVFILQVHLRSPRPLLRIQLCNDGVKEGDGLRHVRAELGVLLGGGFLLEVKGRGKGQSCSEPASLERPPQGMLERTKYY